MAAKQILFLKKSYVDVSQPNVVATASQGNDSAAYALNRNNFSAWVTTGSVDADNTTYEVDWVDERTVTDILLKKHNFKNFTIQYWNGSTYVAFSTPISVTNNTETTNHFEFAETTTSKIKITITGTQVANSDKYLFNLIVTKKIGRLEGWPIIKNPTHSKNLKKTKMLSGKSRTTQNIGAFSCKLSVSNWNNENDLDIVEQLYSQIESFLVWLCGGDEDQFSTIRQGYRLEDIYLMKCTDAYTPEYVAGLYKTGLKIEVDLEEVTE